MIEAQARNLKLSKDLNFNPIGADAALSQFRWLMGKKLDSEAALPTPNQTQQVA